VSRTPQLRAFPKPTISTQQVPHEQLYDLETDPDELRIGLALLANATTLISQRPARHGTNCTPLSTRGC
jgi:hypothetical protein